MPTHFESECFREVYFMPREDITVYELAKVLEFFLTKCRFDSGVLFPLKVSRSQWEEFRDVLRANPEVGYNLKVKDDNGQYVDFIL